MSNFSNEDKDIFLVKLERMIDRGALLSRYSRASNTDIRDVYRKEFAGNEKRGEEFYKRVFLEYGDESIAELVTAQMAVQNVSNVVSKTIEELRVGLSFLEKSSRYVRYDRKVNGRYLFLDPSRAGIDQTLSPDYEWYCQSLFELYARNYEAAQEFYRKKYPAESLHFDEWSSLPEDGDDSVRKREILEKSYANSIRARALDDLRYLLPASTLTNIGISGNGRSYTYLIQKLKSCGLPEADSVADAVYSELKNEFPELIDSALSRHGLELISYKQKLDHFNSVNLTDLGSGNKVQEVLLLDYEDPRKALLKSLSIYEFSTNLGDMESIMKKLQEANPEDIRSRISSLASMRGNRRHKLHRAFESVSYLFQITTNYGAFRDLQRHRFISINRQPLTTIYGYDTPEFFSDSQEYLELMKQGHDLWRRIADCSGSAIAQYAVPYAYRYPVAAYLNLRELAFFCELRSTPQAHHDLRRIAAQMYGKVQEVHPELASLLKFVDISDYALGRLKSESARETKLSSFNRDRA